MRTYSRRAATAAAVLAMGCAPAMMGNQQSEEAVIRARSAEWVQLVANRNTDAIVGLHTPTAVIAMSGQPEAVGTDAIRQAWTGFLGTPNLNLTWQPTGIRVAASGDLATEVGSYQMSFDGPGGRVNDRGAYTTVWQKVNGQWLVASDMTLSTVPPPAPVTVTLAFDTSSSMAMQAAAATGWTDLVVPGFPAGAKLAVIHGDPGSEGDYTLRLWFPDGYEFPAHWHPKAEHVTVLSGSLHLAMGDAANSAAVRNYGPGDFLYLPLRVAHFGGATGVTVVQLHGIGPFAINVGPSPR